jgi:hypothetical protein
MSATLVNKLLESFSELDRCIAVTREMLRNKRGVPVSVLERVAQYSEIVDKQRLLAQDLKRHIAAQEWDEVARHVKLINALSAMIRDDAQAILAGSVSEASNRDAEVLS